MWRNLKLPDLDHLYANIVSAGAIAGSWVGHLPTIAAVIGGAWYALQIWESRTVRIATGRVTPEEEAAKELIREAAVLAAEKVYQDKQATKELLHDAAVVVEERAVAAEEKVDAAAIAAEDKLNKEKDPQ